MAYTDLKKMRATKAKWRRANPTKVRAMLANWRAANPEKVRAGDAKRKLKRNYGLSTEQASALLFNGCQICGGKATSIDHDHDTRKVRGGLCGNCNSGIGMLKDSPLLLVKAAAYLMDHGKEI